MGHTGRPVRHDPAKGILAGIIGGLAATWGHESRAQRLWTRAVDADVPESAGGKHDARDWQERDEHQNSNELAAQALACGIAGRRLTRDELAIAAPLVHYSFGAAVGGFAGVRRMRRRRRAGSGIGLGTALWITADELAMPVLGLSGPDEPPSARNAPASARRPSRLRLDHRAGPETSARSASVNQ